MAPDGPTATPLNAHVGGMFGAAAAPSSRLTDQSSILSFIESNWSTGQIGGASYDALAGPLTNMLDFTTKRTDKLILDPTTGERVH